MSIWSSQKNQSYFVLGDETFENNMLKLITVRSSDIDSIRIWRNEQIAVLRQNKPIKRRQQIKYFKRNVWNQLNHPEPTQILFALLHKEELIGYGGLVHISWQDRKAEISFLLDSKYNDQSAEYIEVFTSYLKLITEISFGHLNLHRIFTETWIYRQNHISALENTNFIKEGVLVDNVLKNGQYVSSVIHAKIKD